MGWSVCPNRFLDSIFIGPLAVLKLVPHFGRMVATYHSDSFALGIIEL